MRSDQLTKDRNGYAAEIAKCFRKKYRVLPQKKIMDSNDEAIKLTID